ncbi:hypothetical protein H6P81_003215 [Aristolochia fimbriata]|uniref:Uncharacterized protein n=1 Tax=Aristolochia fimbriata TaxID=158543 RepID=A0AAV7FBY0_ARIFI|nr:hypothetical protein H6P81_003215 [Aristolochia fimbriata]
MNLGVAGLKERTFFWWVSDTFKPQGCVPGRGSHFQNGFNTSRGEAATTSTHLPSASENLSWIRGCGDHLMCRDHHRGASTERMVRCQRGQLTDLRR